MIMRSLNDDGFDELPIAPSPPLINVEISKNRVFPNWRFVRFDSPGHRKIAPLHDSIAAPHIRQTAAAAAATAPELEFNTTIYYA